MAKPERVHFYVPIASAEALEHEACDRSMSLDEFIDSLFSDEAALQEIAARPRPSRSGGGSPHLANILCSCCPKWCRHQWLWRNTVRCGCSPERIAFAGAGGKLSE